MAFELELQEYFPSRFGLFLADHYGGDVFVDRKDRQNIIKYEIDLVLPFALQSTIHSHLQSRRDSPDSDLQMYHPQSLWRGSHDFTLNGHVYTSVDDALFFTLGIYFSSTITFARNTPRIDNPFDIVSQALNSRSKYREQALRRGILQRSLG